MSMYHSVRPIMDALAMKLLCKSHHSPLTLTRSSHLVRSLFPHTGQIRIVTLLDEMTRSGKAAHLDISKDTRSLRRLVLAPHNKRIEDPHRQTVGDTRVVPSFAQHPTKLGFYDTMAMVGTAV